MFAVHCLSQVWIRTEFQTCIKSDFGVRIHTLRDIMFESVVFECDIRQGMNSNTKFGLNKGLKFSANSHLWVTGGLEQIADPPPQMRTYYVNAPLNNFVDFAP
jgi:hypothetical protein